MCTPYLDVECLHCLASGMGRSCCWQVLASLVYSKVLNRTEMQRNAPVLLQNVVDVLSLLYAT